MRPSTTRGETRWPSAESPLWADLVETVFVVRMRIRVPAAITTEGGLEECALSASSLAAAGTGGTGAAGAAATGVPGEPSPSRSAGIGSRVQPVLQIDAAATAIVSDPSDLLLPALMSNSPARVLPFRTVNNLYRGGTFRRAIVTSVVHRRTRKIFIVRYIDRRCCYPSHSRSSSRSPIGMVRCTPTKNSGGRRRPCLCPGPAVPPFAGGGGGTAIAACGLRSERCALARGERQAAASLP